MRITEITTKRPLSAAAVVLVFLVLGAYGFMRLPVDFLPSVTYPLIVLAAGAALIPPTGSRGWLRLQRILAGVADGGLALAAVSGAFMFLKLNATPSLTRLGYTGFEIGLALALLGATVRLVLRIVVAMSTPAPAPRSNQGGETRPATEGV
jgi:hypothetical protein